MQTGYLEGEDRAAHGEQAGWKELGAKVENHSGDKCDAEDDGKVLHLGCGCDSIRVMREK